MATRETQLEFYKRYTAAKEKRAKLLPEVEAAGAALRAAVYKDGVLSLKVKRLIGLAIGCVSSSIPCILGQTRAAVAAGATKEEIMEALSVVLAMRGTSGYSQGWRVAELLEELGLM